MTRKLSLRSAALFSAVCMLLTGAVAGCKSNKPKDTDSDSSGIISSDFSSDASAGNEPTVSDNQSSQSSGGNSTASSGGQNTASGTGSTDKTVKGTVTVLVAADAEKETAAYARPGVPADGDNDGAVRYSLREQAARDRRPAAKWDVHIRGRAQDW